MDAEEPDVGARAGVAASAVRARAGRGTWHYWWQAHLLDAHVDQAHRHLEAGDVAGARRVADAGHRILSGVRRRRFGTLRVDFFDDLAWMALAVDRLAGLEQVLGRRMRALSLWPARLELEAYLRRGLHDDGGVVWHVGSDFRNTPAVAPLALHWARRGYRAEARELMGWLDEYLRDEDTGLYFDGVRGDGSVVAQLYTYNQGLVLGLLLELGDGEDLRRAGALVRAVADRLTDDWEGRRVLRARHGDDGMLFHGILARYLALAARADPLSQDVRGLAAELVSATADALWQGRRAGARVFSWEPARAAVDTQPEGREPELSSQLAAWLVLEADAAPRDAADLEPEDLTEHWDKHAASFDRMLAPLEWVGLGRARRWVASRAHGRVLDVAAGTGGNFEHFDRDVELVAVDWSPEMLRSARRKAREQGRKVAIAVADAESLPFADGSFDAVVITLSLCGIPDHGRALREAARVLRPSGDLLLLDHVEASARPVRLVQAVMDAVTVPVMGEHWRRRPRLMLEGLGLDVLEEHRDLMGALERVHARVPA